jgi:hypothetical protein
MSQDEKAGEVSVVYVQKTIESDDKIATKQGCPVRSVACGQKAEDLLITGRF